ncbi:MAG: SdrD B-like domain-containing protein [Solirubrobacterales bacterium]
MRQNGTVLRKAWRSGLATMAALVTVMALPTVAAAVSWPDENAMRNSPTGRDTFVYDPGQGDQITRKEFVQAPLVGYFEARGFDANFLHWAPTAKIDPGATPWAGCEAGPHVGPCPISSVHFNAVNAALFEDSTITALHWKGPFISTVCGNFSKGGGTGPTPRIAGVKYEDLNANGKRDGGEPGLSGWTIRLRYEGKLVASTTTAGNGSYSFELDATKLPIGAGKYTVEETLKTGWVAEETPGSVSVPPGAGNNVYSGRDFGNYRPATLAGHKFDDSDVGGEWDPLEVGLPEWAISLSNGEQRLTDEEGAFSFSVRPGTYTVAETLKEGWRQTAPGSPGTRTYTVISGQVVDGIEFGNVCLGDLSVLPVDEDTGEPVPMEVRLEEVSVPGILENEPSLPRTMTGTPTFDELLPGTYRVIAFLPDGYFTTDTDVESVEGRFAIVKEIEVRECEVEELDLDLFTKSTPGKVTGGVKIPLLDEYATSGFTFRAQTEDDARGTLQYNDHETGLNLHTRAIEAIRIEVEGERAIVWGMVDVAGEPQRFFLRLLDAGEPGTADQYELVLAGGYSAGVGETLIGGNVQIH